MRLGCDVLWAQLVRTPSDEASVPEVCTRDAMEDKPHMREKDNERMVKSVFLRRIVLLILAAVLLSGLLSAGIYIFVSQKLYADMRAKELLPAARGMAELMSETQQAGEVYGQGVWLFLAREDRSFLGAVLHIYNANGESVINDSSLNFMEGEGKSSRGRSDALSETATSEMIAGNLKKVLNGDEVSDITNSPDGQAYLVVGVPIQSTGGAVGAVVFTKSMSELNDTLGSLNLTLVFSTLIAFLIMLIPAYFATRHLIIPLRRMQNVANAMAAGDFSVRADETRKGEVGELARSLNHFAEESTQLEQVRRDYVANISHELRTPITSIRAMGETLRDGMTKSDEKKELFYNNIVRESMRLSRLVDDLLELSRLQAGTEAIPTSRFDLREVLRNIANGYGHLAEDANLSFRVDADMSGAIPANSNPDRVEQLLIILMDNAIKHTAEGGVITLSCNATSDGLRSEISVKNTGETIPENELPLIFERFYKVDKSHSGGGTGLGLSIANEIIKGLKETIRAKSADGVTSFTFTVNK
jgi:signal transduction histidine kinase